MKELKDEDNPYNQSVSQAIVKKPAPSKDNASLSSSRKAYVISQEELIKLHGEGNVFDISQYIEGSYGDYQCPPKVDSYP